MARRSLLFTPGDRPEMMRTALESGADAVIFDLEDAVSPDRKTAAREAVGDLLADAADAESEVCVRVESGRAAEDLDAVLGPNARLDTVVLPKVAAAEDVEAVAALLTNRDSAAGVFALIESARGVLSAHEIAAHDRTEALIFGAEDLAADLGASRSREGTEVLYARQRVVLAAAAYDRDAIDTVFTEFGDSEGLRAETARARRLGYDGKLAIHPDQIEAIHDAFRPDPEEIEWAERVLAAEREAKGGVFEADGEMIDAPLLSRAERILELASAE
ncbi:CoA ester lyase [Saliphagus sp. LR7]|uniref:HpcH/HpaI aldolase/citrate lyase family protein n=1 Tax=Saliphagus sp. LR7 TaxID=2282654 RepID=UPI000DF80B7D|nr:CoA ester lyase [Saliphagus sp. LR7]